MTAYAPVRLSRPAPPDPAGGAGMGHGAVVAVGSVGDEVDVGGAPTRTSVARAPSRAGRVVVLFVSLTVALGVLLILSVGLGQMGITPAEVLGSILNRLGLGVLPGPAHPNAESALWAVRMPRLLLAAMVGAALATGGVLMQGVFGNPLAEPGVIGVSSGAAVGACTVIVLGLNALGTWTAVVAAFIGGLITTAVAYSTARQEGRTEVVTLVLTGVAVNAVAGAIIAFLTFLGDTSAREEIVFWQLGSLNGTRWEHVLVAAPVIVLGVAASGLFARRLDLLALGERPARHLGVDVERLRIVVIVLVAILTSAAVAFCGVIAFVGLVVPHLVRMLVGPGHTVLLPASALGGAVLLLAADLAARTVVPYADLPIGMLTALVGGPFFFYLIRRTRRGAGGWS
ncbi:iron ABC transporter permease [Occultella aeris]|uniref:Hemin transport system permease protein HmuU n=1 Tax=Occultella aeris TaxID=2761496 RepID=A0A7M4DE75_9MICO|nr:iron ABC transporter permease [Occultella aeris]VZO35189.1 Hemin transport system permease protein HmuU [Occultella aeris]